MCIYISRKWNDFSAMKNRKIMFNTFKDLVLIMGNLTRTQPKIKETLQTFSLAMREKNLVHSSQVW